MNINTAYSQTVDQSKNLQLQVGDEISVFSDKAYRKRKGELFEAVGNVVILHKNETLYGQSASFDLDSGIFEIKGNVRYVTQGLTLYGSEMRYNMKSDYLIMHNARLVSDSFNIVAYRIERKSKIDYEAVDAEFSTCKNCPESWSVYGERLDLTLGEYVTIKNGLIKVNGTGIMIIPYIVLPVKKDRESGLLFPKLSQRFSEGVAFEQPWFWAIDDSKDITLTPTFWATRGYGTDIDYRQMFGEKKWINLQSRMLNDEIYLPGKLTNDASGFERFRHISELESHLQWSNNLNQHLRFVEVRDLDMVQEFSIYSDPLVRGSEIGLNTHFDYRHDYFDITFASEFNKNQLSSNADKFDQSYVQVLPQISLSSVPFSLIQSEKLLLNNISIGFDSTFTNFRQNTFNETSGIYRNTERITLNPYIDWNLFTIGPFHLKTRYIYDYQHYSFERDNADNFRKSANKMRTEFSFGIDKIFGLSYEEQIPLESISQEEISKIKTSESEKGKKVFKEDPLTIGAIPDFEQSLKDDYVITKRNAYRHSQDFKVIHHYIFDENQVGNQAFYDQITNSNTGWFDYTDAVRSQENLLGSNDTKILIPPDNTVELQWNNALIKKATKRSVYQLDRNYLKDNFDYSKVGHFNVSQGLQLQENLGKFSERLTRLFVSMGLALNSWEIGIDNYYFHNTNDNILSTSLYKSWNFIEILARYNLNSFDQSNLKTTTLGVQIKPIELLRFSVLQDYDLTADKSTRTLYNFDYIPRNNCYVFNLNFRKTLVDQRVSFNINLNFGDNGFKRSRSGTSLKEKI